MEKIIRFAFLCSLLVGMCYSAQSVSAAIIYESDFSSDPGWETDDTQNFYWDSTQEALFVHASITPSGAPSRYFVTDTNLDPKKSFTLEYDFLVKDHFKYSMFVFGMYSPDLQSWNIGRVGNQKYSESTLNDQFFESDTRFNKQVYGGSITIITAGSKTNWGGGGTGSSFFREKDVWYTQRIAYNKEEGVAEFTLYDTESGEIVSGPTARTVPGEFSSNMQKLGFSLYPHGEFGTSASDSSKIIGAGTYLVDNVHLTQESDEEPELPLSDLLLQYEPLLQFHEDEDYYPMNVEAFVEGSGLWDNKFIDENLIQRSEGNELNLDYLATTTDTSDWYIAFSSDEAGEVNLSAARTRYKNLVASGRAVPTYYAYEGEDSYVDDFGERYEFIVLQYWYFYAMNNWREEGGFNDHEGDWESVFVFLDKETEEPEYVAFSAHHNDGDPSLNILQYESVLRNWEDIERAGDQVTSFVAAGSHANYSFEGKHFARSGTDMTNTLGLIYSQETWKNKKLIEDNKESWLSMFRGLFGTDKFGLGTKGTRGPLYSDVGGIVRFEEPVQWAGIDKVAATTLSAPQKIFAFARQGVSFVFDEVLPDGTELGSSLHEEFISFGDNLGEYNLLPKFWDFTTSIPNESFNVEVTLSYSDEEIVALNLDENSLRAFYYNATEHIWMVLPSTVDKENNEVQFETNHFSIYTIGEVPKKLLAEAVPIKVNWGGGNKPLDTRVANLSFLNTTDQILTTPLAAVATAENGSTHVGTNGTSSYGDYQDIQPEEYGRCVFIGEEEDLPINLNPGIANKLLKNVNLDCSELIITYPELSDLLVYGLLPGQYSEPILVEFKLLQKNNKDHPSIFDFTVNVLE